jgi:hypothetical protein
MNKFNNYEKSMICAVIAILMPIIAPIIGWFAVGIQAFFAIGLIYYGFKK